MAAIKRYRLSGLQEKHEHASRNVIWKLKLINIEMTQSEYSMGLQRNNRGMMSHGLSSVDATVVFIPVGTSPQQA